MGLFDRKVEMIPEIDDVVEPVVARSKSTPPAKAQPMAAPNTQPVMAAAPQQQLPRPTIVHNQQQSNVVTPTQNINAMLGVGAQFEGRLTFEGTVRIDGVFKGEIHSDDTLIVGETAQIEAEIRVGTAIVHGHIRGNVVCRTALHLHAPARLFGDICAPALTIADGVVYEGRCKMQNITEADLGRAPRQPPPVPRPQAPAPAQRQAPPLPPTRTE